MTRNGWLGWENEAAVLAALRGRLEWPDPTGPRPTHSIPRQVRTHPTYKSKTETRFADVLTWKQACGDLQYFWYEPITFYIAPAMTYTPDFLVQTQGPGPFITSPSMHLTLTPQFAEMIRDSEGLVQYHLICYEAKAAFIIEKRRAFDRLKVAASLYPGWAFVLAQWQRSAWTYREVPAL